MVADKRIVSGRRGQPVADGQQHPGRARADHHRSRAHGAGAERGGVLVVDGGGDRDAGPQTGFLRDIWPQSARHLARRKQLRQLTRVQFAGAAAGQGRSCEAWDCRAASSRTTCRRARPGRTERETTISPTKPTRLGAREQSRILLPQAQQLANAQTGTAAADAVQEPLPPQFGGERLVEGPPALVEPTDDAAQRPALRIEHLQRAALARNADGLDAGRHQPARTACRTAARVAVPDLLDVLLDSAVADLEQVDRRTRPRPGAGPRGR